MPFDAPTPRLVAGWRAKEHQPVELRIAMEPACRHCLLELSQNPLELHDVGGFEISLATECAAKQGVNCLPLRHGQVLDVHPLPREHFLGDVVPSEAVFALKGERDLGLQLRA